MNNQNSMSGSYKKELEAWKKSNLAIEKFTESNLPTAKLKVIRHYLNAGMSQEQALKIWGENSKYTSKTSEVFDSLLKAFKDISIAIILDDKGFDSKQICSFTYLNSSCLIDKDVFKREYDIKLAKEIINQIDSTWSSQNICFYLTHYKLAPKELLNICMKQSYTSSYSFYNYFCDCITHKVSIENLTYILENILSEEKRKLAIDALTNIKNISRTQAKTIALSANGISDGKFAINIIKHENATTINKYISFYETNDGAKMYIDKENYFRSTVSNCKKILSNWLNCKAIEIKARRFKENEVNFFDFIENDDYACGFWKDDKLLGQLDFEFYNYSGARLWIKTPEDILPFVNRYDSPDGINTINIYPYKTKKKYINLLKKTGKWYENGDADEDWL